MTPLAPAPQAELEAEARRLAARTLERVAEDASFVGSALAAYGCAAGIDVDGLAAFLGCPVTVLSRLALYVRPEPGEPSFDVEVLRIALQAGVTARRLSLLLG